MTKNSRNFRPRGQQVPQPLPQGLQPRIVAAAIISEVAGQGLSLDDRLAEGPAGRMFELEPRDRALVRSIATVALRRLGTIRAALGEFLEKGLPRKANQLEWLLIAGAAQILYLDVPDHAAVDLAVHAARRDPRSQPYASLVNAVLRNIARARDDLQDHQDPFIDTPQWLAARWRHHYGEEQARLIALTHQCEPTLDLTVKGDAEKWAKELAGFLLPQGSVRLIEHTPINELPGYEDGAWWVQDAAASLPARLLSTKTGETVLDLCAAPGGKTAQLALTGADVTALDRSAERMKRLSSNLERLHLSATIRVGDALTFEAPAFDAILLDAPCTATGTIRRHPDVAWIKRASDITSLANVQSRMLDHALELLKPGGRLVYCTCSLEPEEGEQQIAALLRRNPDVARLPISAAEVGGLEPCITADGDLRTLPCHLYDRDSRRSGLDGFFAARLTRRA